MPVLFNSSRGRQWKPTPFRGIAMAVLRENDVGGGTVLLRFEEGARYPLHDHPGGEESFVLEGEVLVGSHTYGEGDFLWTPPGVLHGVTAKRPTLMLVTASKGIRLAK